MIYTQLHTYTHIPYTGLVHAEWQCSVVYGHVGNMGCASCVECKLMTVCLGGRQPCWCTCPNCSGSQASWQLLDVWQKGQQVPATLLALPADLLRLSPSWLALCSNDIGSALYLIWTIAIAQQVYQVMPGEVSSDSWRGYIHIQQLESGRFSSKKTVVQYSLQNALLLSYYFKQQFRDVYVGVVLCRC